MPLYDFTGEICEKQHKKGHYVTVTATLPHRRHGVVHIAPAFGEDDASVGRKYDLPFVQAGGIPRDR